MKRWFPDPNEFMNDPDEWHAFVLGWCTAVYPFRSEHLKSTKAKHAIKKEPWYYSFGLAMGILTWSGIIVGIGGIIWSLSC